MSSEVLDVNPQDMIIEAERALSEGRFFKARSYTSKARGVMQRTLELHRSFMGALSGFLERIDDMEEKGYDIAEARDIVEKARSKAVRSRYEQAIKVVSMIEPALKRATYLPFPLLNKNVDILTVINFTGGNLNYTVRIENPTTKPLGEIIIKPFIQEGMFQPVQERAYGVIDSLSYKESTFVLVPKQKDWNVGVGREVLRGGGVIMRTKLTSRDGVATYSITVENNSDQIIRDIVVLPMIPASMEPDPAQGIIEHVSPYGSETVDFKLTPASMEKWAEVEDKVVVIDRGVDEEDLIQDGDGLEDDDETGVSSNPQDSDLSDHEEDDFDETEDELEEEEYDFDESGDSSTTRGSVRSDFDDSEDSSNPRRANESKDSSYLRRGDKTNVSSNLRDGDLEEDEDIEELEDDLVMKIDESARTDFRAVEAEYNLITMAPSSFPRRISKMMKGRRRRREHIDDDLNEME